MPIEAFQRVVLAATTALPAIPLNIHDGTAQVTWVVQLDGSGSIAYDIEFTLDNILDPAVSAVFVDSVSAQTTNNVGTITTPIRAIRMNITTVSASSNATFRVTQSGL